MGLSYTIIPTSIMEDQQSYLEHFKSIVTYGFPVNFDIDTASRYPLLNEIELAISKSGCSIVNRTEDLRKHHLIARSYQITHPNHKYESDFTIHFKNEEIQTIMGIHADFNILLRVTTELTKNCGSMIILSAYDAYYIEKGRSYQDIWSKVKMNWTGNE